MVVQGARLILDDRTNDFTLFRCPVRHSRIPPYLYELLRREKWDTPFEKLGEGQKLADEGSYLSSNGVKED